MEALPRKIKLVIALLLSPVPIGALLALVVLLASAQTSLTVSEYEDASKISAAMWRSAARQLSAAVRDQLLSLGLFTALGAAAFSLIAWQVRRGTRRPTLLFAGTGGLTAVYVPMLWQVFLTKEADFFFVPGNEGLDVFIDVTYPGWYEPVRAILLALGSFAQILGLILLTGKHGVSWSAGHQKGQHIDPVSPPLWAHPPRQAALLMLLTPAFLLLYAGVNWGGCCSARLDPFPQPFLLDMQAHLEYLVVPAVPVVVAGLILHLSRARAQVWIGLVVGSVGLPYTLYLFLSATHYSDTSSFHSGVAEQLEGTAWWNQPAIMTAGIAILLLHLASVALLFRIGPPVSAALEEL